MNRVLRRLQSVCELHARRLMSQDSLGAYEQNNSLRINCVSHFYHVNVRRCLLYLEGPFGLWENVTTRLRILITFGRQKMPNILMQSYSVCGAWINFWFFLTVSSVWCGCKVTLLQLVFMWIIQRSAVCKDRDALHSVVFAALGPSGHRWWWELWEERHSTALKPPRAHLDTSCFRSDLW